MEREIGICEKDVAYVRKTWHVIIYFYWVVILR